MRCKENQSQQQAVNGHSEMHKNKTPQQKRTTKITLKFSRLFSYIWWESWFFPASHASQYWLVGYFVHRGQWTMQKVVKSLETRFFHFDAHAWLHSIAGLPNSHANFQLASHFANGWIKHPTPNVHCRIVLPPRSRTLEAKNHYHSNYYMNIIFNWFMVSCICVFVYTASAVDVHLKALVAVAHPSANIQFTLD